MSWADIATVSEAGKASEYFNIGDEKELTIGSETYHVQILGFAHDDKSDGSGKAGITVGLKEIMTTTHNMNSTKTNVGGWEASEMRTYLQNDVLTSLPSDLQSAIKTVDKISDIGNKDTSTLKTTKDKLFLLSFEEVGFTSSDSTYFVPGQGTKYEYFSDNNSRVKYRSGSAASWWLRSASASGANSFCNVSSSGYASNNRAGGSNCVVFGFSI